MASIFFKSFVLEFFAIGSILSLLLYNAFIITKSSNNFPLLDKQAYYQSLFFLFLFFIININIDFGATSPFDLFTNDISAITVKKILILAMIGSLICGYPFFLSMQINLFEYYIIALLALFSIFFLISATDLISIYLCLEMQSLCFYVLAAFNRYSVFSTEAGLKYFVLGAFTSCFFLLGCSIIYGLLGTTSLAHIGCLLTVFSFETFNILAFIAILLIFISFFFKLAVVPFHFWSPDVYDGAPLNSTIIFVLVPKIAFLLLIYRLLTISFAFNFSFIFIFIGAVSVLIGSIFALTQKRIKRLLIYSSISHMGFIFLALATNTFLGVTSGFYYISFYIITGFLIWGWLGLQYNSRNVLPVYITNFASFFYQNFPLAIAFVLAFFSLAGIPPLVGFSMKYFVFFSALQENLYIVSGLIILLSVIGSFYYLRFIKSVFFEGKAEYKNYFFNQKKFELLFLLISLSFLLISFGFFNPTIFLYTANKIALGLFCL